MTAGRAESSTLGEVDSQRASLEVWLPSARLSRRTARTGRLSLALLWSQTGSRNPGSRRAQKDGQMTELILPFHAHP
jgi:hypothetical protein